MSIRASDVSEIGECYDESETGTAYVADRRTGIAFAPRNHDMHESVRITRDISAYVPINFMNEGHYS